MHDQQEDLLESQEVSIYLSQGEKILYFYPIFNVLINCLAYFLVLFVKAGFDFAWRQEEEAEKCRLSKSSECFHLKKIELDFKRGLCIVGFSCTFAYVQLWSKCELSYAICILKCVLLYENGANAKFMHAQHYEHLYFCTNAYACLVAVDIIGSATSL